MLESNFENENIFKVAHMSFATFSLTSSICLDSKRICSHTKHYLRESAPVARHFCPKRRSMKLLLIALIAIVVSTAALKRTKRGRYRCGPIVATCVEQKTNGKCPKVPFCPGHAKRVLTSAGCCCSGGNFTQVPGKITLKNDLY